MPTTLPRRAIAAVILGPLFAARGCTLPGWSAAATTRAPRRVVLYGDSLGWEAQAFFRTTLNDAGVTTIETETFGGTAICDWFDAMRRDRATLHPDAVVIEFSGNALTPCMQRGGAALSGDAYYAKYTADALAALRIFEPAGTRVFFAGTPINRHAAEIGDPNADRLNQAYRAIAAFNRDAHYVDADQSVLEQGRWTATLPCLREEPCTGGTDSQGRAVNVVRAPDGAHFCPTGPAAVHGVTSTCAVWSSGAYRYGKAMADGVLPA